MDWLFVEFEISPWLFCKTISFTEAGPTNPLEPSSILLSTTGYAAQKTVPVLELMRASTTIVVLVLLYASGATKKGGTKEGGLTGGKYVTKKMRSWAICSIGIDDKLSFVEDKDDDWVDKSKHLEEQFASQGSKVISVEELNIPAWLLAPSTVKGA